MDLPKTYFFEIGECKDDVMRTDSEREDFFYSKGINKFLNVFVYPYQNCLDSLFFPHRDIQANIRREELLKEMIEQKLAKNIKHAEEIIDELKGNYHYVPPNSVRHISYLAIIEKSNSNNDKSYEFILREFSFGSFSVGTS